jgi:D-amino-acid dehydrogenase
MVHLNRGTVEGFDDWREDGVDFEMHESGLVFAFLSESLIDEALPEIEILREFGMPSPTILDHNGMQKLDPAFSDDVVGGFHMNHTTERHVRPESLVRGLEKRLREMGVEFRTGVDVKRIERRGTAVRLGTSAGPIDADQSLIATGALAGELSRQLGSPLPLTAGKGYSITVQNPTLKVRHAIELVDARAAVSPFNDALRVCGTMELSGTNLNMDKARVDAVRRAGHKYLRDTWEQGTGESVWVGMRPMSSDGLPIIGSVPGTPNVYVATGHGMLGVTMAAATGNLIASQMLEGAVPPELLPFSPARFG